MVNYKRGSGNYKSSYINFIIKETDQIVSNSTTLIDDSDLKFTLRASKRYYGFLTVRHISTSVADLKITFKVISGTGYAFYSPVGTNVLSENAFGVESNPAGAGANKIALYYFWLKTGTGGGVLQVSWAQQAAEVSNTKVLEGSSLEVHEA